MSARSIALLAVLVLLTAACASGSGGPISVSDAWARPGPAGAETAVYLTIANSGGTSDALVAASSPSAASVMLHGTSTDMAGMTGMAPLDRVDVPAGGSVPLAPGGMHLMVSGLTSALDIGATIDLDLVFEHAGTVHVAAEVRQP
jgi:periplasmic copper chaperone A